MSIYEQINMPFSIAAFLNEVIDLDLFHYPTHSMKWEFWSILVIDGVHEISKVSLSRLF